MARQPSILPQLIDANVPLQQQRAAALGRGISDAGSALGQGVANAGQSIQRNFEREQAQEDQKNRELIANTIKIGTAAVNALEPGDRATAISILFETLEVDPAAGQEGFVAGLEALQSKFDKLAESSEATREKKEAREMLRFAAGMMIEQQKQLPRIMEQIEAGGDETSLKAYHKTLEFYKNILDQAGFSQELIDSMLIGIEGAVNRNADVVAGGGAEGGGGLGGAFKQPTDQPPGAPGLLGAASGKGADEEFRDESQGSTILGAKPKEQAAFLTEKRETEKQVKISAASRIRKFAHIGSGDEDEFERLTFAETEAEKNVAQLEDKRDRKMAAEFLFKPASIRTNEGAAIKLRERLVESGLTLEQALAIIPLQKRELE